MTVQCCKLKLVSHPNLSDGLSDHTYQHNVAGPGHRGVTPAERNLGTLGDLAPRVEYQGLNHDEEEGEPCLVSVIFQNLPGDRQRLHTLLKCTSERDMFCSPQLLPYDLHHHTSFLC